MAIVRKTSPVGLDGLIDRFQLSLWDNLPSFQANWESLHRAYLNPKNKRGNIPEVFDEDEYYDCLITDEVVLKTFFLARGERVLLGGNKFTTSVEFFVQCSDLKVLFPSITHRADEELLNEFITAFNKYGVTNIELDGIVTELESVYNGITSDSIKYGDMNEFDVFKMTFDFTYKKDNCNH